MTVRWGVGGTGGIAARFADAMSLVDGGRIVAVASRSLERAEAYADRFGVPRRYADYAALADDSEVDAVYVATPHSRHEADTLLFLGGGKHVLCEKPFALNSTQGQRMVTAAHDAGIFLMEAMWSRFLPAYRVLGDLLADRRIGDPLLVEADFGFRAPFDAAHRLFDPAQGGGALLDLGIYPLQLCDLVFGAPDRISADATLGATGVDENTAAVLHHPGGGLAVIKAAVRVAMACTARIAGTQGVIELPAFMHCPDQVRVTVERQTEVIDAPYVGDGMRFEIEEVHSCLARGVRESTVWPLRKTLELAATMDTIREQIGVRYPGEPENAAGPA